MPQKPTLDMSEIGNDDHWEDSPSDPAIGKLILRYFDKHGYFQGTITKVSVNKDGHKTSYTLLTTKKMVNVRM